jgi:hypothetical protein
MAEKRPSLNVLSGPLAGRNFVLEDAVDNILIGSDASCGFVLDTPGVSPIHARLWVDLNGATVYDTNSPNGVYVNDDRVVKEAPVRNGDILWLGPPGEEGSVLIQCILPPPPPAAAAEGESAEPAAVAPPLPPKEATAPIDSGATMAFGAAEYLVPEEIDADSTVVMGSADMMGAPPIPPPRPPEPAADATALLDVSDGLEMVDETVAMPPPVPTPPSAPPPVPVAAAPAADHGGFPDFEVEPTVAMAPPPLPTRAAAPSSAPMPATPEFEEDIEPTVVDVPAPTVARPPRPAAPPRPSMKMTTRVRTVMFRHDAPPLPLPAAPSAAGSSADTRPRRPRRPRSRLRRGRRSRAGARPAAPRRPRAAKARGGPARRARSERPAEPRGGARAPPRFPPAARRRWRSKAPPIAERAPSPARRLARLVVHATPAAPTAAASPVPASGRGIHACRRRSRPGHGSGGPAGKRSPRRGGDLIPEAVTVVRSPVPSPKVAAATPPPKPGATPPGQKPPVAATPPPVNPAQQTAAAVANLMSQARTASDAKNYDAAVSMYDEVLKLEPGNAAATSARTAALAARNASRKSFVAGRTVVSTEQKAKGGLSGFDGADVVQKSADFSGRLEFAMNPPTVKPGDSYRLTVALVNDGKKSIKISGMTYSFTVNGNKTGNPVMPKVKEVGPAQRVVLEELPGVLPPDATSWVAEVLVTANKGDSLKNQLTWK